MSCVEEMSLARAEDLLMRGAAVNGVRLRSTRAQDGPDSVIVTTQVLVGETEAATTQGHCAPEYLTEFVRVQRESMLRVAGGLVHPRWKDSPELVLVGRWSAERELFCEDESNAALCVDDASALMDCGVPL